MRFEARELHPYAEPLTASELREGVTYFLVNFVDEKGLIPYSTTGPSVECEFEVCLPADMGFVFEYERALNVLLVCSLRRRGLA